ncbi:MAG: hypothetical protein MN733_01945 [Nitrososphaera sp.]|nr:hypothetical protein [Nitrososphaera sp.]
MGQDGLLPKGATKDKSRHADGLYVETFGVDDDMEQCVVNAQAEIPNYADILKQREGMSREAKWLTFISLLIIGVMYWVLHELYFDKAESFEWLYVFASSGSADVHRMGTFYQAAAMMLLSGITLTAPIFSLSLHQFFDAVFTVADKTVLAPDSENYSKNVKKLEGYKSLINDFIDTYELPNSLYLSIWCTSVIVLLCETFSFFLNFAAPEVLLVEGVFFILINMGLCAVFSMTAFWFFVMVKPGETKLRLYKMHFNI